MIIKPSNNYLLRSFIRKSGLIIAMTVACISFGGNAMAQGVMVNDPTAIGKLISQYAKQIEQFKKQVEQYTLQLQQYQQMLSSIQNISNGVSLAPNQLQHVTNADALIRGKCSGNSSPAGLVSALMNSMSSLMNQSITQTQETICGQIVTTQIKKYNETVDMLNRLHDEYGNQLRQLEHMAGKVNTQADSGRASTQVQKYSDAIATEMGNWQARMKADDAVIETLQNQQSILGHVALNGSSTPLGNVIQATTFAAAFH